jgi:hypothetical protein
MAELKALFSPLTNLDGRSPEFEMAQIVKPPTQG